MGTKEGRCGSYGRVRSWALACVAVAATLAPAERIMAASGEEMALLVLANEARAQSNVPPLMWSDQLAEAAVVHSEDLAAHGGNCDLHDSCNGEVWWKRVQRYYPGWVTLGENVAVSVNDARTLHDAWMNSSGHRANILNSSFTEFGAGIAIGQTNFGKFAFATEDFGSRGALPIGAQPTLPGGAVTPAAGDTEPRELIVSYYHYNGGAPRAVRALVGSSCVNLALQAGRAAYGTYGANRSFSGSGCVPVVFEAIRSDGVRVRWPQNEAILVGVGAGGAYCAERTTAVPTQDCGGGGTPTPTPTPGPTPTPDATQLSGLKVVLKPGQRDASKGLVQIHATLPSIVGFDPSAGSVSLRLNIGQSGDWSESLPQTCDGKPCLKPNARRTSYRAKYGPNQTLNVTRAQDGRWKLRYSSRNETLAGLSPGTVRLTVTLGGRTFSGSAAGELKQQGLVAD
ncbi:MAG: CAP domain-containing protein [Thermodesulfobacteriota bacterium]